MQFTVTREKDGMMLSKLLLQVGDMPPWAVKQAMKKRDVRVDNVRISEDVRVHEGQDIRALNRKLGLKKQQLWSTRLVFHASGVLAYLEGKSVSVDCPF